jgi:hypothetical protein
MVEYITEVYYLYYLIYSLSVLRELILYKKKLGLYSLIFTINSLKATVNIY